MLIDDFSRFSWLYLLETKDEALLMFKRFQAMVERQFDTKIQCVRSDGGGGGGEFQAFQNYLATNGLLHQVSCPCTPQQNGRVERKNRHVVEVGLSLLIQTGMPLKY